MKQPALTGTIHGNVLALAVSGAWVADNASELEQLVDAVTAERPDVRQLVIDFSDVERLDTVGAWLIEKLVRDWTALGLTPQTLGLDPRWNDLISEVRKTNLVPLKQEQKLSAPANFFTLFGRTMHSFGEDIRAVVEYLGAVIVAIGHVILRPLTFRGTSLVHHIDMVGLRAVPIIMLITFLIGAIIAQQGIFHFSKFGADLFVVDMVGILVLREIGVLLVAIMIAGRSGSAYTAELGSMKMREEMDALRVMGFDPVEVLLVPRILALIIALPALTFIGSITALVGGGITASLYGNISISIFLDRLKESLSLSHFLVGMSKAPFMALMIGLIACVEGLRVEGSAESLGKQTTSSVVKAIFLVIVVDGLFAIFFATINV